VLRKFGSGFGTNNQRDFEGFFEEFSTLHADTYGEKRGTTLLETTGRDDKFRTPLNLSASELFFLILAHPVYKM